MEDQCWDIKIYVSHVKQIQAITDRHYNGHHYAHFAKPSTDIADVAEESKGARRRQGELIGHVLKTVVHLRLKCVMQLYSVIGKKTMLPRAA